MDGTRRSLLKLPGTVTGLADRSPRRGGQGENDTTYRQPAEWYVERADNFRSDAEGDVRWQDVRETPATLREREP